MTTALNYAHMEECIAGTVGQFDEAEAFVRTVPLDNSLNGRAGGAVELWTARRRISEIASWGLVVVIVEITAAARAKTTVTATYGDTSFSTLRRSSVDHTIRAGERQRFPPLEPISNSQTCDSASDRDPKSADRSPGLHWLAIRHQFGGGLYSTAAALIKLADQIARAVGRIENRYRLTNSALCRRYR